ncbi:uncharacterized protein LOC115373887 isoform X2 [Myripristis murdjan]|nr:uncharacterized protein LOC115373887 isoform X2 [Myripristis murdjan]
MAPTEKTTPGNFTAQNPSTKPGLEENSEDISKSTESGYSNGFTDPALSEKNLGGESRDAFKDLDSHENVMPNAVGNNKAPSGRKATVDTERNLSSGLVLVGTHQASSELTDLSSGEGVMLDGQEAGKSARKQAIRVSGVQVAENAGRGISVRRNARPGGDQLLHQVDGLNGMLAPGWSREQLDRDSFEVANGRPAAGNSRDVDYDETREFTSIEMYPAVPPRAL